MLQRRPSPRHCCGRPGRCCRLKRLQMHQRRRCLQHGYVCQSRYLILMQRKSPACFRQVIM